MADGNIITIVQGIDVEFITWVDYKADLRFADFVTVTDSVVVEALLGRTFDDIVTVTDEIAAEIILGRILADDVVMSDTFDRTVDYNIDLADSVTVLDSPTASMGEIFETTFSDAVAMSDSFSAPLSMEMTLADSVAMSDVLSHARVLTLADSVVMSDAMTAVVPDTNFADIRLLLHADGPETGQNGSFLDSGPNGIAMTPAGFPAQGSQSPFATTGASMTVNPTGGNTDRLAMAAGHASCALGAANNFTIEAWVFKTMSGGAGWCIASTGTGAGGWSLVISATDKLEFWMGSTKWGIPSTVSIPFGVWTHVAIGRRQAGLQIVMYVNGNIEAAGSIGLTDLSANLITLAGPGPSSMIGFGGAISDFRVVKGTDVYDLTPGVPTAPLTAVPGTSILLNFNNAAVVDAARFTNVATRATTSVRAAAKKFGTGGLQFNNSNGEGIFVPNIGGRFAIGANDFTMEFWHLPQGGGANRGLWDCRPAGGSTGAYPTLLANSGVVQYFANGAVQIDGGAMPGSYAHYAVSRVSGQTRLFVNGVQVGATYADATSYLCADQMRIGNWSPNEFGGITGQLDDIRFTRGVGRYTANFTPPTAAFPNGPPGEIIQNKAVVKADSVTLSDTLTGSSFDPSWANVRVLTHGDGPNNGNNNTVTDTGPNAFAITRSGDTALGSISPYASGGGSAFFDGNGDFLAVASPNANLAFGTGDWTLEFWFYPLQSTGVSLIDFRPNSVSGPYFQVGYTSGVISLYVSDASRISGGALALNAWHHVAFARVAGQTRMFLNGVLTGVTWADPTDYAVTVGRPVIAGHGFAPGASYFNGLMSDIRMVKGTGLYTASFTPPTVPLTAITNTALLLSFAGVPVLDSARKNNFQTVGDAKISTAQSKFGGSSIQFDGNGDYLLTQAADFPNPATGDWTIEFWMYATASTGAAVVDFRPTTVNGPYPTISYAGLALDYTVNGASVINGGSAAINTWHHVALCKAANQTRLFLNGVQIGVTFADTLSYNSPTPGRPVLGGNAYTLGATPFFGFIEDFRWTMGVGRYTANFTPPTAAFPNGPTIANSVAMPLLFPPVPVAP